MATTFFTTAELSDLKAIENSAMPSSLVHKRPTYASNGQGGQTLGTPTTIGTYPGRIYSKGVDEVTIGGQVRSVETFDVAIAAATVVLPDDYFETGGATFRAIGAASPLSYETATHVLCVEVS
jgi:hypothetical protein